MVASFLSALESFQGMLFITTNRVGTFDDAFVSRIDVKLYYPNWQFEDRQKIWKSFMTKLKTERQQHIRVTMGAKEYILGPAMEKLDLNGREIRNAFQTAVALAEFEQNKDEEGTILLEEHHVQQVADMSRDFRMYLDELHRTYLRAFAHFLVHQRLILWQTEMNRSEQPEILKGTTNGPSRAHYVTVQTQAQVLCGLDNIGCFSISINISVLAARQIQARPLLLPSTQCPRLSRTSLRKSAATRSTPKLYPSRDRLPPTSARKTAHHVATAAAV
jgi:hypothetical protein